MSIVHNSRKQRQLKYLVKKLNILLQRTDADLRLEIKKISDKIKYLVTQLNGIISTSRMKRILGTIALFIGLSFSNTASAQWFTSPIQDPFNLQQGNNEQFINPEFADLDNDGDLDYLLGEYFYTGYGYDLGFRYQENIGSATSPTFSNAVDNPFELTTYGPTFPELSIRQHHRFIDIDNDGDFDILSNVLKTHYYYYYEFTSDFVYYENIGDPGDPKFAAPTVNPFGLTSSATIVYTDLGDIDGDGDVDILGFSFDAYTYSSDFLFIENIGSDLLPNFTTPELNVFGIPQNQFALLALEDIDTDGDLDIMFINDDYISSGFGYVENTGTASAPEYSPPPTMNPFGLSFSDWQGIGTLNFNDLDGDGDNDLIVGTDDDFVSYFENVGIPQSETYECINYSCVDPGTGQGSYLTLDDCQANCIAPVSFECSWSGSCYDPGDGTGPYTSYDECMNDCSSEQTWTCDEDGVIGSCYDPGDGTGSYTSYNECVNDCSEQTWTCDGQGNCFDPGTGEGDYATLGECQANCTAPVTFECDFPSSCYDPGTGQGTFATLADCQEECNSTSIENTEINNLKLYPNPLSNTLNVSSDKKIKKIEIYDALGKIVISKENPPSTINVEKLENGIYSIAIIFEGNRILRRFTK